MPLFGGLTEAALGVLLDDSREVAMPAGAFFFHEGDTGESLYVLDAGEVELTKATPAGPVVLAHLQAGDCFGEMALIDLAPRSASAQAVLATRALEISMGGLHALYQRDVEQFALVQMNMARELSRRLRRLGDRLRG
ncbi:MAG: cyclic nucleotide-binding domain-containing protein [Ottowia sp.]|uniref:cyclic nucleotide-binding domain-containing protein n=1 Tax=Ottowia sp. TaxID=1898956 RepID=UPI0039E67868